MKRCADLTAKSVSLLGEAISNGKNLKRQSILIGTTFLVCGFFYYLFSVEVPQDKQSFDLFDRSNTISKNMLLGSNTAYAKEPKEGMVICNPEFITKVSYAKKLEIEPELCKKEVFKSEEELAKEAREELLKSELAKILNDTPMEEMIDALLLQKKPVIAYLVGIAFKESKFGVYSPKKAGKTCYNYWGYKGKKNVNPSGYSCFDSPEEAIKVVGKRIEKLAIKQKRTNPAQMTVWKCGSSCATHSPQSVRKWILDVDIFYRKIMAMDI